MAYVFRIHDVHPGLVPAGVTPTAPIAAANINDWSFSDYIEGKLIDNIELSLSPRKMGTSIPSIFSRIFLFDGAFSIVGDVVNSHILVNPNTKLVSECLDMLEFLYQNGGNGKLIIRHWNAKNNIDTLRKYKNKAHAKLADVLENEISQYPELSDIYLFSWKDVNTKNQKVVECLIGGTSPYSLVFTSPNWKREIASYGWRFNRLSGTQMFDEDNIESIENRASKFKEYVYSVYNAYSNLMQGRSIRKYLDGAWAFEGAAYPNAGAMAANQGLFNQTYDILETTKTHYQVTANNVPIATFPPQKIVVDSEYEIVSSSNRYKNYNHNGAAKVLDNVPLVLNDAGLGSARYCGETTWNLATCKINQAEVRGLALHERILPGVGIKYPFVIASDFLEDSIIKLPYSIDSKNFITAFAGDSQYLLPLKPYFFQFFEIDDLDKEVEGDKKMFALENVNDGVKAVLRIPVKYRLKGANANSVIKFEKTYRTENTLSDKLSEINIGIFPFYRNNDIPTITIEKENNKPAEEKIIAEASQHNKYVVAMAAWNDVNLSFLSVEKGIINTANRVNRSKSGQTVSGTFYYNVNSEFDFIDVDINKMHGMLIPRFRVLSKDNVSTGANFAIDFGTSNTYMAMKIDGNAPEPLTINRENPLVVFSKNKSTSCSCATIRTSEIMFEREFIPALLGVNESVASFPIRTVSCELNNFNSLTPHLFGNISVGFNYMNEVINTIGDLTPFNYVTDLKWAIENGKPNYENRVKQYFKGLLWIIKSKSLMESHGLPQHIYVTFPNAMTVNTRDVLFGLWKTSMEELNLDVNVLERDSESVAPYHAFATEVKAASFMNLDIGGGTTDVLFIQKEVGGQIVKSLYSSAKFAADDLWGDGVSIVLDGSATSKDNGFRTYLDQIVNQKAVENDLKNKYNSVCKLAKNSADIIGFLFKNESAFNTSYHIKSHPNLFSLLIIHYAALMYNVSRMMVKENLDIPEKVSFTGMGSLYTKMIAAEDNDLTVLTKIMLETFTGKIAPGNFIVTRQPNSKRMTADGALVGPILDPNFKVDANGLIVAKDYGFDTDLIVNYDHVVSVDIKKQVIEEYYKFLNLLSASEISNHLASRYKHVIKKSLIDDLRQLADSSYNNVCHMLTAHGNMPLQETLFFLPLKQALYEASRKYNDYN